MVDRDGALTVEGEVRCLKLALLREEEDEAAGLALVGLRDVEVVDRASGTVDLPVVRCTVSLVWVLGGDRDNQVRVLVVAIQVGWAGRALTSGSGLRLGCHSLSVHGLGVHSLGRHARGLSAWAVLLSLDLGDILSDRNLRGFSLLNRLGLVHSSRLLSGHGCLLGLGLIDSRLLSSRFGLLLGLGRVYSGWHDLGVLDGLGLCLVNGCRLVLSVLLGLSLCLVDGSWLVLSILLHLSFSHRDGLRRRAGLGLRDSRGNGLLGHSRRG